ncbi:MAG: hypothetical protein QOH05_2007, partial [Acetobacteraceae bacterium]|nr:hypothetical protein [Acetobacteraceae bacterium]
MSLVAAAWDWYARNREVLTAVGALVGGGLLTWGALQQPAFASHRLKAEKPTDHLPSTTELFSRAVEQLGSSKVQVCLGGIYTLERISRESRQDYGAVMEILTALVRQRAPWHEPDAGAPGQPTRRRDGVIGRKSSRSERPADVAAALAVIMRRESVDRDHEETRLDLRRTNLKGASLIHAPLRRANLFAANLIEADLTSADLRRANLRRANLSRANVIGANLSRANMSGSNLSGANFRAADLSGAIISWADLSGVILYGANLREATIIEAQLCGATLHGADFRGADLSGSDISAAELGGADLSCAN